MISIAGDIGGTKCWMVALQGELQGGIQGPHRTIYESCYQSRNFSNINDLMRQFLQDSNSPAASVGKMVLAVAGPVREGSVQLTNLDWQINSNQLQEDFSIQSVRLINDFQAAALGTLTINSDDFVTLNEGTQGDNGIRLVLGAGTGLGMAYLYMGEFGGVPVATEGGHIDFAPTDEREIVFLRYLNKRYRHVSYERILSGTGLVELYHFCLGREPEGDPVTAEWINKAASDEDNPTAQEAIMLFVKIYGHFVGNMALAFRPGDGIYLTGGVTAKLRAWLDSGKFVDAYLDKGRMLDIVANTSLRLVTNERVGLQGAIAALEMDYMQ